MRELNPDLRPDLERIYDNALALADRLAAMGLPHDRYSGAAYRIATDVAMAIEAMTVPSAAECAPRAPLKAREWCALMRNRFGRVFIGGSVSA